MRVYTLTLVDNTEGCTPVYAKVFENYGDAYAQMKSEYAKVASMYKHEASYQIANNRAEISANVGTSLVLEYYWNIYETDVVEDNKAKLVNVVIDLLSRQYAKSFTLYKAQLTDEVNNYVNGMSNECIAFVLDNNDCENIILDIMGSTLIHKATDVMIGTYEVPRYVADKVHDYVGEINFGKFFDGIDADYEEDCNLYALLSIVYGNENYNMETILNAARTEFDESTKCYAFNDFAPNYLAKKDATESYFLQVVTLFMLSDWFNDGTMLFIDDGSYDSSFELSLEVAYNVSKMFYERYKRTLFENGTIEEYLEFYIKTNIDDICDSFDNEIVENALRKYVEMLKKHIR